MLYKLGISKIAEKWETNFYANTIPELLSRPEKRNKKEERKKVG